LDAERVDELKREIEKFMIRQPTIWEKDDYDSENSWISDGLPSSSRRRRRGDGRWEGLARTSACPSTTVAFARTSASSLTPSKPA